MKQYFVYQWTNIKNGMKYIGSHEGDVNDGYKGSGKWFKRAYKKDPNSFVREILSFHQTREEMKQREQFLLEEVDAAGSHDYYNLCNTSTGGNLHSHLTKEEKASLYQKTVAGSRRAAASRTQEEKDIIKKKKQETWNNSPKREAHSLRTKQRRAQEEQNKSEEQRQLYSQKCSEVFWSRPTEDRVEQYKKVSNSATLYYQNNPEVGLQKGKVMGAANKGKRYINKDGVTKKVKPEELDTFIEARWCVGLPRRNNSSNS